MRNNKKILLKSTFLLLALSIICLSLLLLANAETAYSSASAPTIISISPNPPLTQDGDQRIDICNVCHPFFSGKQKLVDTAGRIEKFERKYGKRQAK